MQLESAKYDLCQISLGIPKMVKSWHGFINSGRIEMNSFCRTRQQIFDSENRLNNLTSERVIRTADKHIRVLYDRLSTPIDSMKNILQELLIIRDEICRFLSRTRMHMDDEILSNYAITPNLRTPQMLEILEFLRSRYDPEWEVKEMVVMALEDLDSPYDMELMLEGWCGCCHAGGEEFDQKLKEYFDATKSDVPY